MTMNIYLLESQVKTDKWKQWLNSANWDQIHSRTFQWFRYCVEFLSSLLHPGELKLNAGQEHLYFNITVWIGWNLSDKFLHKYHNKADTCVNTQLPWLHLSQWVFPLIFNGRSFWDRMLYFSLADDQQPILIDPFKHMECLMNHTYIRGYLYNLTTLQNQFYQLAVEI